MIVRVYQFGKATVLIDDSHIQAGRELEETLNKIKIEKVALVTDTTNSKRLDTKGL